MRRQCQAIEVDEIEAHTTEDLTVSRMVGFMTVPLECDVWNQKQVPIVLSA